MTYLYFDVVHHQVTIEIDDQTKFITAQTPHPRHPLFRRGGVGVVLRVSGVLSGGGGLLQASFGLHIALGTPPLGTLPQPCRRMDR